MIFNCFDYLVTFAKNLSMIISGKKDQESVQDLASRQFEMEEPLRFFIETYGCQMNVSDSEVVTAIMKKEGFINTNHIEDADVIFINTCSIRDNAEQRVRGRLDVFKQLKKKKPSLLVGVIGCMAERLKEKLLEEEKVVDLIVGPDAYRDLHHLVRLASSGQKAVNVMLSREETYANISPVRLDANNISAFVAIMRGCNNMCSYCVVPYTRGGERSRDHLTILQEVKDLVAQGYKEVTLIGQNVDSYSYNHDGQKILFPQLLEEVALLNSSLRVRFSTSHPKDMTDEVLHVMARHDNICKSIHLPAQSGSSRVLDLMKRNYTREWYLNRIEAIKRILPDCSVSTDIIAGFCGETEEDHQETLSLMKEVGYDFAYMFKYSERPGTYAARHLKDDVSEEIKTSRLSGIIALQNELSLESKKKDIGRTFDVLIEGTSKKSTSELFGRTSQNKVVVFPSGNHKVGEYVKVTIIRGTSATLIGKCTD
jgi:tRNA-2-methylthio-N6-dimethylallyladenosine synthase